INGIVTFKNSGLAAVLPAIGLDRILTETDSPYLAPVPRRGRRNESAYIPYIVDKIAQALAAEPGLVDEVTTANAKEFFHFQH
uniref:TatD family hydrolase n=1 Tax=uncultured Muribaculum sp. TaxID=1918613 RepID=UPI0025B70E3C